MTDDADCVTLMTIHSAKGLEFENVYVIGMEDGIFPGTRSMMSDDDMEEERRLAYVAVTRAKQKLCLIHASLPTSTQLQRSASLRRMTAEIS